MIHCAVNCACRVDGESYRGSSSSAARKILLINAVFGQIDTLPVVAGSGHMHPHYDCMLGMVCMGGPNVPALPTTASRS